MSEYKYDSRYGYLISNVIPFNVFSLLLSPLFIVTKSEHTLRWLNNNLMICAYSPIALIATIVFFAANVILCPFAYVVALFKKVHLLLAGTAAGGSITDLIGFILFG